MTTEIIATQGFGAAKRLDDGRYRIIVSGEAEADLAMRAPELLAENEALKTRIAELEADKASMEEHLEELQKENDGLMDQVEELELTLSGGKG